MLSKIAIHGDFPLVIDHFISKMADLTQQSENPSPSDVFQPPFPPPFHAVSQPAKMNFRGTRLAMNNKKPPELYSDGFLTEMERFELSRRLPDLPHFECGPFSHLGTSP